MTKKEKSNQDLEAYKITLLDMCKILCNYLDMTTVQTQNYILARVKLRSKDLEQGLNSQEIFDIMALIKTKNVAKFYQEEFLQVEKAVLDRWLRDWGIKVLPDSIQILYDKTYVNNGKKLDAKTREKMPKISVGNFFMIVEYAKKIVKIGGISKKTAKMTTLEIVNKVVALIWKDISYKKIVGKKLKDIYFEQITCEDFFQGLANIIDPAENSIFISSIVAIMAFWHSKDFVNLPSGMTKIEQCFSKYLKIWE